MIGGNRDAQYVLNAKDTAVAQKRNEMQVAMLRENNRAAMDFGKNFSSADNCLAFSPDEA